VKCGRVALVASSRPVVRIPDDAQALGTSLSGSATSRDRSGKDTGSEDATKATRPNRRPSFPSGQGENDPVVQEAAARQPRCLHALIFFIYFPCF
jgi:hypothetical protein